jgi:hypothetical protein
MKEKESAQQLANELLKLIQRMTHEHIVEDQQHHDSTVRAVQEAIIALRDIQREFPERFRGSPEEQMLKNLRVLLQTYEQRKGLN